MIKFNKFNVTNGAIKARVHYSIGGRVDGTSAVTIYAKDTVNELHNIFSSEYKNDSDSTTDYFESGKVVIFESHPLYGKAKERALAA